MCQSTRVYLGNPSSTLPQKKHNFNLSIFPGAPGYLNLIQCHVKDLGYIWYKLYKDCYQVHCRNDIWLKVHRPTLLPKERQLQKSCVSFGEECILSICNLDISISSHYIVNLMLIMECDSIIEPMYLHPVW